jgi:hypothetical protein
LSIAFPLWILGNNPNARIGLVSETHSHLKSHQLANLCPETFTLPPPRRWPRSTGSWRPMRACLVQSGISRCFLGDGHCDLVEHVMCDSALGWNLRNEIAHGTIRPETLTAMRVFLAWLLLVRLTCFVARPPAVAGPKGETTADNTAS